MIPVRENSEVVMKFTQIDPYRILRTYPASQRLEELLELLELRAFAPKNQAGGPFQSESLTEFFLAKASMMVYELLSGNLT